MLLPQKDIDMPLTIKKKKKSIAIKKLSDFAMQILKDKTKDFAQTNARREKIRTYLKQLEGQLPKEKAHDEEDACLSIPITLTEVDLVSTRHYQALTQNEDFAVMKPVGKEDVEKTGTIEQWFNWYLNNYLMHFKERLEKGVRTNTWAGMNIFYQYYWREIKPVTVKETYALSEMDVFDDLAFVRKCLDIIKNKIVTKEKLGKLTEEPALAGDFKFECRFMRKASVGSMDVEDKAIIDFYPNDDLTTEVIIESNRVEYDGVILENVCLDNFWFPATVKDNFDLQRCNHVCRSYEMSYSQVVQKYKDKTFDLLTDEDIENLRKNKQTPSEDKAKIKNTSHELAGISSDSETDKSKAIIVYDCFYYYDINNDMKDEHVFCVYIENINKVALIRKAEEVFRHGKRPFVVTNYSPRPESIFGVGIAETLHDLQEESDTLHNLFINDSEFANKPFGVGRTGSSLMKRLEKQEIKIKRGTILTTENPLGDLVFPQIRQNPNWTLQDLGLLRVSAQDAIGTNDMMSGREQHSRTPVGSTLKLLEEAGLRIKQGLIRFNFGLVEVLKQIYQLIAEYGPDKQIFRVIGKNSEYLFSKISREDLKTLPDFELGTAINHLNKVYLREHYLLLGQQIFLNPLLVQMGLIQPYNIYNYIIKLLNTYDIPDRQKLITEPRHNPLLTQEEELWMIASGQKIEVNPLDKHDDHLRVLMLFKEGIKSLDEARKHNLPYIGLMELEYMDYVEMQIRDHEEILQQQAIQKERAIMEMATKQQQGADNNPAMAAPLTIQRPKTNPMMPTGGQPRNV